MLGFPKSCKRGIMMAKGKNGNNEGSIRKRKNGTWEGRYTIGYDALGKQKQISLYGKTRAEVARKLNEKTAKRHLYHPA